MKWHNGQMTLFSSTLPHTNTLHCKRLCFNYSSLLSMCRIIVFHLSPQLIHSSFRMFRFVRYFFSIFLRATSKTCNTYTKKKKKNNTVAKWLLLIHNLNIENYFFHANTSHSLFWNNFLPIFKPQYLSRFRSRAFHISFLYLFEWIGWPLWQSIWSVWKLDIHCMPLMWAMHDGVQATFIGGMQFGRLLLGNLVMNVVELMRQNK